MSFVCSQALGQCTDLHIIYMLGMGWMDGWRVHSQVTRAPIKPWRLDLEDLIRHFQRTLPSSPLLQPRLVLLQAIHIPPPSLDSLTSSTSAAARGASRESTSHLDSVVLHVTRLFAHLNIETFASTRPLHHQPRQHGSDSLRAGHRQGTEQR